MAALGHDGHEVICGICRTPFRGTLLSYQPLQKGLDQLQVDDVEYAFVQCDNCGSDLGDLESVQSQFVELVQT